MKNQERGGGNKTVGPRKAVKRWGYNLYSGLMSKLLLTRGGKCRVQGMIHNLGKPGDKVKVHHSSINKKKRQQLESSGKTKTYARNYCSAIVT